MKRAALDRDEAIHRVGRMDRWDLVVIGGGATGVAVALDAVTRGLTVLLLDKSDLGKGTSSRSTKLVHGGVRYLQQGNMTLVRDALRERSLLKKNAPDLVHELAFLIPCRRWWQKYYYAFGLKLYDLLAGRSEFPRSHTVSKTEAKRRVSTLKPDAVSGGVVYYDGQFDDARLLIRMAELAADSGACLLNYAELIELEKNDAGQIRGVTFLDRETGRLHHAATLSVVNATGPFCDEVRRMDEPECERWVTASQGVHLVLPKHFLPGDTAIIVPKTSDGRVIFIIPWLDHVLVGTTDTAIEKPILEPMAQPDEIAFLLETASQYLIPAPTPADILSVFTGIRPLVKGDPSAKTASLSRDHVIRVSPSGLITITGGKWTTVRKMAEDCVDRVLTEIGFEARRCMSAELSLPIKPPATSVTEKLHPQLDLTAARVVTAVEHEMARTVEDVLARRSRALFLDAQAALEVAPQVARIMAEQLGRDDSWQEEQLDHFRETAKRFLPESYR